MNNASAHMGVIQAVGRIHLSTLTSTPPKASLSKNPTQWVLRDSQTMNRGFIFVIVALRWLWRHKSTGTSSSRLFICTKTHRCHLVLHDVIGMNNQDWFSRRVVTSFRLLLRQLNEHVILKMRGNRKITSATKKRALWASRWKQVKQC